VPPIVVDTSQPISTPTPGGQPLFRTVTIGDAMPFRMLFSKDVQVSLMSLQIFSTLQITISGLTSAPPVPGPNKTSWELMKVFCSLLLLGQLKTSILSWSISSQWTPCFLIKLSLHGGRAKPQCHWCHHAGDRLSCQHQGPPTYAPAAFNNWPPRCECPRRWTQCNLGPSLGVRSPLSRQGHHRPALWFHSPRVHKLEHRHRPQPRVMIMSSLQD
jgi:hypothetical protein